MTRNVLIVDDNSTIRALARSVLEEAGFEVIEARNGAQGLEEAKVGAFCLVLADVNMPVMDGLSMIRKIRELDRHRQTPILILSTENTRSILQRGKEAGANGWMVKPFRREKLLAAIEKLST